MPVVNPLARELVFKIVYYGPGLGGKTTTLQYIHATTKAEHRGKMVSLATPVDRTLYFDFLPIRVPHVRGMGVRLQLFTVPGQVYYNATRKLVLTGADGVVMVLDSQRARADANLESLENLRDNLREHGRMLRDLPHVIAYNKRDLPEPTPIEEMEPKLNLQHAPSFATVATNGAGVYETLEAITRLVLEDFERRIPAGRDVVRQQLELPEGGLADALRGADDPVDLSQLSIRESSQSGMFRFSQIPDPEDAPGEHAARAVMEAGSRGGVAEIADMEDDTPSIEIEAALPEAEPEAQRPLTLASPPEAQHRSGLSFAALWNAAERGVADELEAALVGRNYVRTVLLSDQLVARTLAGAAGLLASAPEAPRDPATVAMLLGLDGRRYLEFRALVRDARTGQQSSELDALSAYAFALEAKLARPGR